MGFLDRTRGALGSLRSFHSIGRRLFRLEEDVQRSHAVLVAQGRLLDETQQRVAVLDRQMEHLQHVVTGTDPQMTLDIVRGVRDDVHRLAVELAERANATSDTLASAVPVGDEAPSRRLDASSTSSRQPVT